MGLYPGSCSSPDDFESSVAPLQVITVPPATGQAPTGLVVALHGWGSNAQDLASLTRFLNLPDYQFLFPNAPLPHPSGSGGRMWYDFQEERPGLVESRQLLNEWLQSLEKNTKVPLSRTVLVGFSQGAAMTLDVGLNLPLAGLVALSGYLHPLTNSLKNHTPPVLIVQGRQDQVVPLWAAQSARNALVAAGATVQYQELDMGHEIKPIVLALVRSFVQIAVNKQVR